MSQRFPLSVTVSQPLRPYQKRAIEIVEAKSSVTRQTSKLGILPVPTNGDRSLWRRCARECSSSEAAIDEGVKLEPGPREYG
jgi:hypothetical protein